MLSGSAVGNPTGRPEIRDRGALRCDRTQSDAIRRSSGISAESAGFARPGDPYIIVLNINTISGSCLHPE